MRPEEIWSEGQIPSPRSLRYLRLIKEDLEAAISITPSYDGYVEIPISSSWEKECKSIAGRVIGQAIMDASRISGKGFSAMRRRRQEAMDFLFSGKPECVSMRVLYCSWYSIHPTQLERRAMDKISRIFQRFHGPVSRSSGAGPRTASGPPRSPRRPSSPTPPAPSSRPGKA